MKVPGAIILMSAYDQGCAKRSFLFPHKKGRAKALYLYVCESFGVAHTEDVIR